MLFEANERAKNRRKIKDQQLDAAAAVAIENTFAQQRFVHK